MGRREPDQVVALAAGQEGVVQGGARAPGEVLDPRVSRVETAVETVCRGAVGLRMVAEDGLGAVMGLCLKGEVWK